MERIEGHVDGERAEFAVAADLVSENCRVSYTHGNYKYDLVADKNDNLIRFQVKKANQDGDKPWKYRIFTKKYEKGEVDIFAGYVPREDKEDKVFYATFDEVASEFRVNSKTGEDMNEHNKKQANLIDRYTFERAISKLANDN